MTKRDLVVRISDETGLVQQDVLNVVQKTLDYISDAVTRGQKVELRNFGVFEVKQRAARKARNPRTGDKVYVPPKNVVTFKPGKEMEELVRTMDPSKLPLLTGDDDADEETDGAIEPNAQAPGQTHAQTADPVD